MDETSIIERVARALCDDTLKRWRSPIALKTEPWREFVPAARAAIEAMRAPTDDMARAGFSSDAFRTPMLRLEADFEPKAVWQAMIDAALSQAIGNKESGAENEV